MTTTRYVIAKRIEDVQYFWANSGLGFASKLEADKELAYAKKVCPGVYEDNKVFKAVMTVEEV